MLEKEKRFRLEGEQDIAAKHERIIENEKRLTELRVLSKHRESEMGKEIRVLRDRIKTAQDALYDPLEGGECIEAFRGMRG